MIKMIVILCDNYKDAITAFNVFLDCIKYNTLSSVIKCWPEACCLETDDDLRYIFIDYRFKNLFNRHTPDFIDVEDFFMDLDNSIYYFG